MIGSLMQFEATILSVGFKFQETVPATDCCCTTPIQNMCCLEPLWVLMSRVNITFGRLRLRRVWGYSAQKI